MELPDRFIEVLDILCHRRRSDSFPRFLDYQCLATFLDTHLLKEYVHDYQHHDREKHGIILYFINLKDDEPFIKEVYIQVGVQRGSQLATPVKLLQDGGEVPDAETDFLLRGDLRDALQGKLIVGVEGQFLYPEPAFLYFQVINLFLNLYQERVFIEFLLEFLHNAQGTLPFCLSSPLVMGKRI